MVTRPRILIVEDNENNRMLVRDVLQSRGYRTEETDTGEEGVRLAQTARPALILMDIQLPEVSGLQVSDYRKRRPEQVAECYRDVFSLFEAGRLTIPEPTELPLSDFCEGLRLVDERAATGRILLIPPMASEEIAAP